MSEKRKRLTVLVDEFRVGGAQHMVYELIRNLDRERLDVEVLCYKKRADGDLSAWVEELCPVTYLGIEGQITPRNIWRVLQALQQKKPDLVHAHLGSVGFGTVWAILFRKKLIVTVHTKPEKAFRPRIEKLVRFALKLGRTKLVAVSDENAAAVKAYFGIDDRKCVCINNGVDLSRFERKPHEDFTLINVARQDENKNQAALVRCFARLHEEYPQTRLLLVGDGETHQALAAQVTELGLDGAVMLTGSVSNTEDYYAVSDLYVQCSHREGLPLSVLEAMAAGLPIVSTAVGGLADVVRENGTLVPDRDEDALYEAIEAVYEQPQEVTDAMCQASKRIVRAYSSEEMARAYEKLYDTI